MPSITSVRTTQTQAVSGAACPICKAPRGVMCVEDFKGGTRTRGNCHAERHAAVVGLMRPLGLPAAEDVPKSEFRLGVLQRAAGAGGVEAMADLISDALDARGFSYEWRLQVVSAALVDEAIRPWREAGHDANTAFEHLKEHRPVVAFMVEAIAEARAALSNDASWYG